ncbi:low molecular weight protein-tyrosine-phosphatase [Vampirovibrio chlorellavorus]|uniref:low molecular weight protein-tyrosine-phosphatase n=1 Tax=Vampirovibrio chlorellavorus TaxID=758823 RepID=UPI0026EAF87C|nr:low molecular weight protein-tyrosine-phosphatase [Vampirovibrio chlorellavorus]
MSQASSQPPRKVKIMFVCMGNICRSPSAEGVFHYMVQTSGFRDHIEVASSGTDNYHVGAPADGRSHAAALNRGIDLSNHRAQQFKKHHFDEYDYILVMDRLNHDHVMRMCPHGHQEKVHYFLDFAPQLNLREVPDPYYGGAEGFDRVLDYIEAAAAGLLSEIRDRHLDPANLHPEIKA